ncbi:hypothetical protein OMCYN_01651 [cyanobiont of Ornithocercus magnificus]|nr:hypothetical protein OMCYN_01651 [cyanobiont of Ornithocercus magnificus]
MKPVSDTIPNYVLGISEQPDEVKLAGQVVDAEDVIPDITGGLRKRPAAQLIADLGDVDATDPYQRPPKEDGCWFHYSRDAAEGGYIGQVSRKGGVRVWRSRDGRAMKTEHSSTATKASTPATKTYLTHNEPDSIQSLTINDATFLVNREKSASMKGPHTADDSVGRAFVSIKQLLPKRQYGLNIFKESATMTTEEVTATLVSVQLSFSDVGSDYDTPCRYSGTKVVVDTVSGCTVRVTIAGRAEMVQPQNTRIVRADVTPKPRAASNYSYKCNYQTRVELLYGGSFSSTDAAATGFELMLAGKRHRINIKNTVTSYHKADIAMVRPVPIDLELGTSLSAGAILGAIAEQIKAKSNASSHKLKVEIVGQGLYIENDTTAGATEEFYISALDSDVFSIIRDQVSSIDELPPDCKHGYTVRVSNLERLTDDDYWLTFVADDGVSGSGHWQECVAPGTRTAIDETLMPVELTRAADGREMNISTIDWEERSVAQTKPKFLNNGKINQLLFYQDRLAILSGSTLILSRPGDIYNFWRKTGLTFSGIDSIEIDCAASKPGELVDGIETAAGLLLFAENALYLLTSAGDVLDPKTARIYPVADLAYNRWSRPVSLGKSIGFLSSAEGSNYSRFLEVFDFSRDGRAEIAEQSKVVETLLPKDLDLIACSQAHGVVLMAKSRANPALIYGYRYHDIAGKRVQGAWFKWRMPLPIHYLCIIGDGCYVVLEQNSADAASGDHFAGQLYRISLQPDDASTSDSKTPQKVESKSRGDTDTPSMSVVLPTVFPRFRAWNQSSGIGDSAPPLSYNTSSTLIIQQLKVFGYGTFKAEIYRRGRVGYEELPLSGVAANTYADSGVKASKVYTVPIHCRNVDFYIKLLSDDSNPAALHSVTWEGVVSDRFPRRF